MGVDDDDADLENDDDAGHDDDGGGDGAGGGGLAEEVAQLRAQVGELLGGGGDGQVTEPVKPAKPAKSDTGGDIESQVRRAVARIGKEQETDRRLEAVEQKVEKPPVKLSRLARAFWGNQKADA